MNDLVAILFLVFLKPHASDCGRDVISEDNLFMVEADVMSTGALLLSSAKYMIITFWINQEYREW